MSLQAQQIVNLACQIAKCPAYVIQAGQFLNNALQSLAQDYDFMVISKTATFNFNTSTLSGNYAAGSGPNVMPTDFLRAHRNGAFYMINGVPYTMIGASQEEFDSFVQQPGNASYPSRFYIDMSTTPPSLFVWVPASGAYPATVRYNPQMPDITTPESSATVPWFPNSDILITYVAGSLMNITDDARAPSFLGPPEAAPAGWQAQLNRYLKMKDGPQDVVKRVTLDRRYFGNTTWSRLPNTKSIGWALLFGLLLAGNVGQGLFS
jgi:hypothetical protein